MSTAELPQSSPTLTSSLTYYCPSFHAWLGRRPPQVKPRRADDATRITLVTLSSFVEWRRLLTVVKPETLIRWHRKIFRLWWRWKSRAPGRPPLPVEVQLLIATMAAANRTWGEERIAAELLVKLGIRVSPRTVRRYMPSGPPRARHGTQAWSTFVRNHARWVLASDFFVVVTATFRVTYVFVVLEIGTRRILHWNVTEHPTAEWTAQQFRMIVPGDQRHRFVIHDRDTIYSEGVDRPSRRWVWKFSRHRLAFHKRTPSAASFNSRTQNANSWRGC
jgi:hypothetical protein